MKIEDEYTPLDFEESPEIKKSAKTYSSYKCNSKTNQSSHAPQRQLTDKKESNPIRSSLFNKTSSTN